MQLRAEVYTRKQLDQALKSSFLKYIYAPYSLIDSSLIDYSDKIIIVPPVYLADCEDNITEKLINLKNIGFNNILVHTVGHIQLFGEMGFNLYGGHRLNCVNSDFILFLAENYVRDVIVSPEATAFQINNMNRSIPVGFLGYGYLPLMITRRCPIKNGKPCNKKNCKRSIKDRMNNELKIICSENTAEILNSDVLFLADKLGRFENAEFCVLKFTTEENIDDIILAFNKCEKPDLICNYTRGLYFRGVN